MAKPDHNTDLNFPGELVEDWHDKTLEKLDDRTGGQDVIYRYDVINLGDELSNVMVEDSELGTVLSGLTMVNGDFASVDVTATLFGTTVNTAQASGTLANGNVCAPATASDWANWRGPAGNGTSQSALTRAFCA